MKPSLRGLTTAGLLLVSSIAVVFTGANPARADVQLCDKYGSTVQDRYVVMNNLWASDTPQCIRTTSNGFTITDANHNKKTNGAPVSYTAIYLGCHYNNCSPGTNLPMQVSQISSATSSASFSYPASGVYNAAYDIWLDPSAKKDGENKLELMIWFNKTGPIHPFGSWTGSTTVDGHTWAVWTGDSTYRRVVSYAAPSTMASWNFNVMDFINDAKNYSDVTTSWYLTSIQAGFEPWVGGSGLAVTSFAANVNGGGPSRQDTPSQPATPAQPGTPSARPSTPAASVAPSRQPTPQPSAQTKADGHAYVVQPGDTLCAIARREHVIGGWRSLYKRNRDVVGSDPDLIRPGQRLSLR